MNTEVIVTGENGGKRGFDALFPLSSPVKWFSGSSGIGEYIVTEDNEGNEEKAEDGGLTFGSLFSLFSSVKRIEQSGSKREDVFTGENGEKRGLDARFPLSSPVKWFSGMSGFGEYIFTEDNKGNEVKAEDGGLFVLFVFFCNHARGTHRRGIGGHLS